MVAGLTGGDFGAVISVDAGDDKGADGAGAAGGAGGAGGVAAGAGAGSGLGEHAVSNEIPINGRSSMKRRRSEKICIVFTLG